MHRFIVPFYIASVTLAFVLGSHNRPKVEAVRVTYVLPESREVAYTRAARSF